MINEIKGNLKLYKNFPTEGINFVDISPILADKKYFNYIINKIYERYKNIKIDKVASIESRGFVLGSILAHRLGAGFVMIRKKGKLPGNVIKISYKKEYGEGELEIQADSIRPNERILLIDDVLATGGTLKASIELIKKLNANIKGVCCLIELEKLRGRGKIEDIDVFSLIRI